MKEEFRRFGLTNLQRKITGVSQIAGAIGLLMGFWFPSLGGFAAAGLAILMGLGWVVRLKIKDSFIQSLPAFAFMILNGYLSYYFFYVYLK